MLFRRKLTAETLQQVAALEAERLHQVALQLAQHQVPPFSRRATQ